MTLLPALLAVATAAAGPLADLDAALARFPAKAPVRARFTVRYDYVNGDGKDAVRVQGEASGGIADGPAGLEVTWPRALLDQVREEDRRRAADAEAKAPAHDGVQAVAALDLAGHLDAAEELRQALVDAVLVEDRQDALDGAPARLLVVKLAPKLSARDRKFVKAVEATGRLWLGADGVPLAAEVSTKASGRAFLVVSFSAEQRESYRLEQAGDRLVAVRHESSRRNEGAGEKGERTTTTTLSISR
ncbi:MAG: hypothetical protein QM704_02425 [Anaeromyxobacteraceae bacterium]